jgi:hypothetical protein
MNLEIMMSTHLSAPKWRVCLNKTIKSFPENLKSKKFTLFVDYFHFINQNMEVNSRMLPDILKEIRNILEDKGLTNYRIKLSAGGLRNNIVEHLLLSDAEYSLICEYDFMFTSKFLDVDFDKLLDVCDESNIDFVFFSRTSNSIEQLTTSIYQPITIQQLEFMETKFYTNNTHLSRNSKFLNTLLEMPANLFSSHNTYSYGIEVEMLDEIKKHPEEFKCVYYGGFNDGPFIHHLDGSNHFSEFDLYFNNIGRVDVDRETINYSLADSVIIKSHRTPQEIDYIKQVCEYNNMNYGIDIGRVLII